MGCAFRCTQYMVALCLLFALGLFVTAGAVNYWWIKDNFTHKSETGLWRGCDSTLISSTCAKRSDIFKFKDSINKDIVLAAMVGAAFMTLISLILIGVTMCQRYPSKLMILIEIVFLFFGVGGGALALVWALVKFDAEGKKQGWAFYCLYGGDGLIIIAFVFSIVLFCIQAPGAYRSTNKDDEIAMLAR